MNSLLKTWLNERIDGIDSGNANYNDHIDQFFNDNEWMNIYNDCLSLFIEAIEYLSKKKVQNCLVVLIIPLISRNNFCVDYDIDISQDIPDFVFDKRNQPPSLYVFRQNPTVKKFSDLETYIRPLELDPRLSKYNCTSVYRCERSIFDVEDGVPFERYMDMRCYLD